MRESGGRKGRSHRNSCGVEVRGLHCQFCAESERLYREARTIRGLRHKAGAMGRSVGQPDVRLGVVDADKCQENLCGRLMVSVALCKG